MQLRPQNMNVPDPAPQAASRLRFQLGAFPREYPELVFLARAIRNQRKLIATTVVLGTLATLAALFAIPRQYTAIASLLLDTRPQKVFNAEGVLPGLDSDLYVIESQLEILKSNRIGIRVLQKIGLPDGTPAPEVMPETLLKKFQNRLSIERLGRSYVVQVRYSDSSPERATQGANAIVDAYLASQIETKQEATRDANHWLKDRVAEIGNEVEQSGRKIQDYRIANLLIDTGNGNGSSSLLQRELTESVQQLGIARAKASEAEAKLQQVEQLSAKPDQLLTLDTVTTSTVIADFRRQQAQVQRRIGELTSSLGSNHPQVVSAKAELEKLNAEISNEVRRILSGAKLGFEARKAQVALLEKATHALQAKALEQGEHLMRLSVLERDAQAVRDLYSSLLRRYKETQTQETLYTSEAHLISEAIAPQSATFPTKSIILPLAALGWLGLGVGLAFAREWSAFTLRTPEDVEKTLAVPCIASLPYIGPPGPPGAAGARPLWLTQKFDGSGSYTAGISATKRWLENVNPNGSVIVAVLSAGRRDGRSTVAAELARYAAATGTKTLLIDGDARTAQLTKLLDENPLKTFYDGVLNGVAPEDTVVKLPQAGLNFVAAPDPTPEQPPIDVLGSRNMAAYLKALRARYDFIVIDTPALQDFADASALIPYVDANLIVVPADQVKPGDIVSALQAYGIISARDDKNRDARDVAATAVGAVLNANSPANPSTVPRQRGRVTS